MPKPPWGGPAAGTFSIKATPNTASRPSVRGPGKLAAMQLDISRYSHFVDRFHMPEEQKVAILTQIWTMMESFVDRAFGQAPEQQLKLGSMGNKRSDQGISAAKAIEGLPSDAKTALNSVQAITPTFNDAAKGTKPARKRRR